MSFTYGSNGKTIKPHASTSQGTDFGCDGQVFEVGDTTLTMTETAGTTVLRRSEREVPAILGQRVGEADPGAGKISVVTCA